MRNRGQFRTGMNTLVKCRECGKLTHSSIDGCLGINLCRECYEAAGIENEHSDGLHEDNPDRRCPSCQVQGRFGG